MNKIDKNFYQKNLDFWETAWSRVKEPSVKIPDVLEYIPEIPLVFSRYDCHNILDIACGSGWLSFYLNEHGFKVTGVDISVSAIRLALELLQARKSLNPKQKLFDTGLAIDQVNLDDLNFVQADIFSMNLPEKTFDGILINAAFEHLDYVRGKEFLERVQRFLKPGAVMFAVFDKVASGTKGEFTVLNDGSHQYFDKFRDGMLLRNYSDEELRFLLSESHWQIESWTYNKLESRVIIARSLI